VPALPPAPPAPVAPAPAGSTRPTAPRGAHGQVQLRGIGHVGDHLEGLLVAPDLVPHHLHRHPAHRLLQPTRTGSTSELMNPPIIPAMAAMGLALGPVWASMVFSLAAS
jgi:hypothetical protein